MCEADFPSSERDALMGLVDRSCQGQVAQLTAAKEELHKQVAELKRAGKRQAAPFSKGFGEAADPSVPETASRVWGRSATESRRLPMKSPSRL